MIRFRPVVMLTALATLSVACDDDDDDDNGLDPEARVFTVRIENVSTPQTLPVERLDGVVPLSPGVFVRYTGANPLFTIGSAADDGTEDIAEDGNNAVKLAALGTVAGEKGGFSAPGGPDNAPTLAPGEFVTFTVNAEPGDLLQFQTMFAQSNDWFYAFGGNGLALFNGNTPVSGDVTSLVVLYDAGTEADVAPGTGATQAPAQDSPDTGADDPNNQIRVASGFATIPANASVIRVTISSVAQ